MRWAPSLQLVSLVWERSFSREQWWCDADDQIRKLRSAEEVQRPFCVAAILKGSCLKRVCPDCDRFLRCRQMLRCAKAQSRCAPARCAGGKSRDAGSWLRGQHWRV